MTGSVQIKSGKYYMVINTKVDGKRKQKWIPTGLPIKGNKTEAKQQLAEYLAEHGRKGYVEPSKKLFCDFMRDWVEMRKKVVEDTTHETNIGNLKKHIYPFFEKAGVTLSEVTSDLIEAYCEQKASEGLNPNSVIRQYVNIRSALQYAYKKRLIPSNPCDFVTRPKAKKYHAEFYNADEIKRLKVLIKGTPLEVPVSIAAYFGLTRSEVLGLRWSAIDMVNKTLIVRQKVVRLRKNGEMVNIISSKLKTEARFRILPLDDRLVEMLQGFKEKQERTRQLCGDSYSTEYLDYVCVNALGELLKPQFISKGFSAMLKEHGLEHGLKKIRFHGLRHSCATLLLALGYSMKEVQEWLGHADYDTTANTYAHVDPRNKVKMIRSVSDALEGEDSSRISVRTTVRKNGRRKSS